MAADINTEALFGRIVEQDRLPALSDYRPIDFQMRISSWKNESSAMRNIALPIGLLHLPNGKGGTEALCTGTLLSKRYILTAGHCYREGCNSRTESEPDAFLALNYLLPFENNDRVFVDPCPVEHEFDRTITERDTTDMDYAIYEVMVPSDISFSEFPAVGTEPESFDELNIIHVPRGYALSHTRCFYQGTETDWLKFVHNCETREVSSGAPIFDEEFEMIGIHVEGQRYYDPETPQYAIKLASIVDRSPIMKTLNSQ